MSRDLTNSGTATWCDKYHFTMAGAWFNCGKHLEQKTSEAFFRKMPKDCGYVVNAGLGEFLKWVDNWHVSKENMQYLRSCKNRAGGQLFSDDFLKFIEGQRLSVDIRAVPEGEPIFAGEPVISVTGPCWQVEMVEAAYLNVLNAQAPIATKASRIVHSACCDGKKRPVFEFGLRRATELGGVTSTRAALIGGCQETSNCLVAQNMGLQGTGTMAHSWVLSFESELEAFKAYLQTYKYDGILLVDTYDTHQGIKNAIRASLETNVPLLGIRIDSGDLGYWGREARRLLDESGFKNSFIIASNDIDEFIVENLVSVQKAPYDIFAAGTKIVTADDFKALGGVYKTKEYQGEDKMKIAQGKTTIPGATNVLRAIKDGQYAGDVIVRYNDERLNSGKIRIPLASYRLGSVEHQVKHFGVGTEVYPLLKEVVKNGKVIAPDMNYGIQTLREKTADCINMLGDEYKRLRNPHIYGVGQEANIELRQQELIKAHQEKMER